MTSWKYPALLIAGIGISNLGNWIYLIALNLSILHLTGSAAAVAGIYVIRPIATLITNTWSGSVIDRVNKRKLMILIDVLRGLFVLLLPIIMELWIIYFILFVVNVVGAFFGPSSSAYITKLVPKEKRKRFNSIMSMTSSGAFVLGPAIAGFLIMFVGTELCILINGMTFLVCALVIYFLPNVEKDNDHVREPMRFQTLLHDWKVVTMFAMKAKFFIRVYLLFQIAMLIGFALDSQEVTFIKKVLILSNQDYGLIVSLTGVGAITGAFVSSLVARRVPLKLYIGGGVLLTSIGYTFFYTSSTFLSATLSFVFLGFFMAFANAGYATYFQNHVPVQLMGRFGSVADMFQGIVQIGLTLILGFLSEILSLQLVCIIFSVISALFGFALFMILMPTKATYFMEESEELNR
jgi:MFS family permease